VVQEEFFKEGLFYETRHMHTRHAKDVHVALYNRILNCNAISYNDNQISELKAKPFLKRIKIGIES
jgi:hypothetical protein